MRETGKPPAWERVLVRHVNEAKRTDLELYESLVSAPFYSSYHTLSISGSFRLTSPPTGRWIVAACLAGQSWLCLFSNETGRRLFDANRKGRRREVAWVGCQPEGVGWFVRINRAGKRVVEFAQGVQAGSKPTLQADGVEPGWLRDDETAESTFRRVCTRFGVTLPDQEVRPTSRGFAVYSTSSGKRVKSAVQWHVVMQGAAVAAGEDPASDALAEAINRCDAAGIAEALRRGACTVTIPDNFAVSPLLSMLHQCGKCHPSTWEACLRELLAGGCPIDGTPPAEPPILACIAEYISGAQASKMITFLLSHGADVNATNFRGETALYWSVYNQRTALARLLLRHGADPRVKPRVGLSTLNWLQWRVGEVIDAEYDAKYAELLELVTALSEG